MTRAEARKQIKKGWLSPHLAARLMGFDLDKSRLEPFTESGAVRTQTTATGRVLSLDDLLSVSKIDINKTLNKLWPIDRRKKSNRVQVKRVLDTQTKQKTFDACWFRLHRKMSTLIATPNAKVTLRELKLMHQLMELSRKANSFELLLPAKKLMTLTGLDDEYLPQTRKMLEARGLIKVTTEGPLWVYSLVDPLSAKPFDQAQEKGPVLIPGETWADINDVA